MKNRIKDLILELKALSKSGLTLTDKLEDPNSKVNVWFVISRLEEILLEQNKE